MQDCADGFGEAERACRGYIAYGWQENDLSVCMISKTFQGGELEEHICCFCLIMAQGCLTLDS